MRRACVCACVLLVAGVLSAAPVITFETNKVVASGITPGGTAVWFGEAHERPAVYIRLTNRTVVVADEDRDGVVELELGRSVATRSVWTVTDLATGATAWAPAPGFPGKQLSIGAAQQVLGPSGTEGVSVAGETITVLLVRPGVGVWTGRAGCGASGTCAGGKNPTTSFGFATLRAVQGKEPAPSALAPRDVVIGIDREQLTVHAGVFGVTL